jgi:hypothetical protein
MIKKYQLIGLISSMVLAASGYIGYMLSFFTIVSAEMDEPALTFFIYWLLAALGIFLFIIFFVLTLVSIISNGRSTPAVNTQPLPSASGQIAFSIINMIFGGWWFSTIFALYALSHALRAKREASYEEASRRLKTAKSYNIVAIILVGMQVAAIILLMILAFSRFMFDLDLNGVG